MLLASVGICRVKLQNVLLQWSFFAVRCPLFTNSAAQQDFLQEATLRLLKLESGDLSYLHLTPPVIVHGSSMMCNLRLSAGTWTNQLSNSVSHHELAPAPTSDLTATSFIFRKLLIVFSRGGRLVFEAACDSEGVHQTVRVTGEGLQCYRNHYIQTYIP